MRNPGRVKASLELQNAAGVALPGGNSGSDAVLKVTQNGAKEIIYLVLRRDSVNDVKFGVFWDSPLTYVRLDESFRVHVDDETGPDWPGEDEYDLDVEIDGDSVFSNSWDDADAGEDWPSLGKDVHDNVQARQGQGNWAAFTGEITFSVLKTDGPFAHGSEAGIIRALDASDDNQEKRTASITVSHPVSDGHITAHASLTKFPPL